jgi:DNA-binding NarL/FixJ family response regulator
MNATVQAGPTAAALAARAAISGTPITVALVEDDDWTRDELAAALDATPDFRCVGKFRSAEDALASLPGQPPDVVLMDINLPRMDGVECLRRLKAICPDVQVLMLTVYEESDKIFNSLLAGASGYLLKRTSRAELCDGIRQARQGGAPMTTNIARRVVQYFHELGDRAAAVEQLTPREQEVLDHLAQGAAYKEIADRLGLSIDPIRMNVRGIYRKLHVHSRGEAVAKYLRR